MSRPVAPKSHLRQPLDAVLSGTAGVRILRALLAHGGLLSVSRLAAETGISRNGTRDALGHLERTGVVESAGSGSVRLYRAAAAHPIVTALEALFIAERARFDGMLAGIADAADLPDVAAAWLFGSVARGDDSIGSDVDIGIVIDAPEGAVAEIADLVRDRVRTYEKQFGFVASIVPMSLDDVRRLRGSRAPLWSNLVREARVLRGDAPEALGRRDRGKSARTAAVHA